MRRSILPSLWGGARPGRAVDPFSSLQREIDRLFDQFSGDLRLPTIGEGGRLLEPEIDLSETDHDVQVTVELPGVDDKDVDVTLTDNRLTIRGEKRTEKEAKGKHRHAVERSFGAFGRTIPIPFDVDADKVDAKFSKGVLSVILPKPAEARTTKKKIEVKAH